MRGGVCAQWVMREYGAHAAMTLVFLVSLSWTAFLINLPLLAYHVNKCVSSPLLLPRALASRRP